VTETELGRGAFATAWLGVERATGRRVAVKSVKKVGAAGQLGGLQAVKGG
jgi:serine/threonine protein kinase